MAIQSSLKELANTGYEIKRWSSRIIICLVLQLDMPYNMTKFDKFSAFEFFTPNKIQVGANQPHSLLVHGVFCEHQADEFKI